MDAELLRDNALGSDAAAAASKAVGRLSQRARNRARWSWQSEELEIRSFRPSIEDSSQRLTRFASAAHRLLSRAGSCCRPDGLQAELLTQKSRKRAMCVLQLCAAGWPWDASAAAHD